MKIFTFTHPFCVGGVQVNTIELGAALRDLHGHEVVLFATPGAMVKVAEERGLRFLPAPNVNKSPTLAMMRALREAVRRERPDVVHVWDWWQCLDAYYAVYLLQRIPMVVTDMFSDDMVRFLPKTLPTTFGTPELVDLARAAGRRRAELLVPPVDVLRNAPNAVDAGPFRERFGIAAGDLTIVTVSRLAKDLKSESIRRTIDAVRLLGRELPLRFLIVGHGDAREELERLAADANRELGRAAVVLTGELLDPRPAYAAADIVVGMGGSALRGMAFGKPAIIVGLGGFSEPMTPETAESFFYKGIFGKGDGSPGNDRLAANIRALAEHPERRTALGPFSREYVVRHFALETIAAQLERICRAAAAEKPRLHVAAADGIRTAAFRLAGRYVPDTVRRLVKRHELMRLSQRAQAGSLASRR